jgi:hypothetical protein
VTDILKRARDYRLYSRTVLPIGVLYCAGYAFGRFAYLHSGHLGLFHGPLGDIRRAFVEAARPRPYPSGGWMDWAVSIFLAAFFVGELVRQQGRLVAARERMLLAAYSLAAISSIGISVSAPEKVYGATVVLAASLFVAARWSKWSRTVRAVALGVVALGMGLAALFLRLRDLTQLGHLR